MTNNPALQAGLLIEEKSSIPQALMPPFGPQSIPLQSSCP